MENGKFIRISVGAFEGVWRNKMKTMNYKGYLGSVKFS